MSGFHGKHERRRIRRYRIRKRISGTAQRPRLSVYRSASDIYAQLIDDVSGRTIAQASSREELGARVEGKGKTGKSFAVGKLVAERAAQQGISSVAFDRGGYLYHGRVKALAEGARAAGLKF